MEDWERLIEEVLKISNFVIIGDRRLGWRFVIDGIFGKGNISSLNN